MKIECIKISPWKVTNVNGKICMTRKVGDKIEIRKFTLWERFCNALQYVKE